MAAPLPIVFLPTGDEDFDPAFEDEVREIAHLAHRDVVAALPMLSDRYLLTVRFGNRGNAVSGEMGRLVTRHWLDWEVDPHREASPSQIARSRLRSSFVHETHHAVRAQLLDEAKPNPIPPESPVERSLLVPSRTRRLAQIAVEEGLANLFDAELSPTSGPGRWDDFTGIPIADWAQELVNAGEGSYLDWFFELPDGRRNVGYRVGAYLSSRAVAAVGGTAATLVGASVDEVLELAGVPDHRAGARI